MQIDEKSSLSSDNDEIELDEKKNKKIKKNGDPLYWFGLFVSPSLRNSQTHFKTGSVAYGLFLRYRTHSSHHN